MGGLGGLQTSVLSKRKGRERKGGRGCKMEVTLNLMIRQKGKKREKKGKEGKARREKRGGERES